MEHPQNKPYFAIMAGGGGTRLWPKSRQSVPKQFLKLFSKKTLLQETYSRVAPLTDNDKIFIIAPEKYAEEILSELPDLSRDNLILEPNPAGTAAAIGLASYAIAQRDPGAVVHFLPADHYIPEVDEFQRVLLTATIAAEKHNSFVIWAIHPTYPATGYEYIQSGEEVMELNQLPVFKVKAFKERPKIGVAQAYVATGTHFWNHGNFSQKVSVVIEGIHKYMPALGKALDEVQSLEYDMQNARVREVYANIENVAFDIGVMVKAKDILMIPVNYTWSDIGSWDSLYEISPKNEGTNTVLTETGEYYGYDTHGCLIQTNGKTIATIGLQDMIIIDTEEIIMICPKSRSQDVKKMVEMLKERDKLQYL